MSSLNLSSTRQSLNSRQWDIQSAKNDSLLLTADAYFNVHQHRGMYAAHSTASNGARTWSGESPA